MVPSDPFESNAPQAKRKPSTKGRFSNPFSAVFTGIYDRFRQKETIRDLNDSDRLDGKTCLVTGANSGLGFGIAVALAKRGAHVIMGCRRPYPSVLADVKMRSGSDRVELRLLELTDPSSIHQFVDGMVADGIQLDVSIHNAGVTPPRARKTAHGLDEMFMVNYLSKFILANALLQRGVIPNSTFGMRASTDPTPRILFISSDSHQNASAIDFHKLGVFEDYRGANRGVSLYSYNKLVLNTYAAELARRLQDENSIDVAVHVHCPGPVNSNIIRDAPAALRIPLRLIFKLFFKDPMLAAEPSIYLAAAPEIEGQTCTYLHMKNPKAMDRKVYDEEAGRRLWAVSEQLARRLYSDEKQIL